MKLVATMIVGILLSAANTDDTEANRRATALMMSNVLLCVSLYRFGSVPRFPC